MSRILFTVFPLTLVLMSCARHSYIVYRDVPESPTFTVLPTSQSTFELAFTVMIEQAIMSNGVRVKQRPEIKRSEIIDSVDSRYESMSQKHEGITESFEAYQVPDDYADYFVFTNRTTHRVKIIKSKTREVLTIFHAEPIKSIFGSTGIEKILRKHLDSMGIPVQNRR